MYAAFAGGDGLEAAKLNFRDTSMRISLGSAGEIARRSRGDRAEIAPRFGRESFGDTSRSIRRFIYSNSAIYP